MRALNSQNKEERRVHRQGKTQEENKYKDEKNIVSNNYPERDHLNFECRNNNH